MVLQRSVFWLLSTVIFFFATHLPNGWAEEGFLPARTRGASPRFLSRAATAAVEIRFDDSPDERCSGVFISSEGHILTALHCISPDLRRMGYGGERSGVGRGGLRHHSFTVFTLPQERIGSDLTLNSVSIHQGSRVWRSPQVIASGIGYVSEYPAYVAAVEGFQLGEETRGLVQGRQQDFAILKVSFAAQEFSECVRSAGAGVVGEIRRGERLWSLGFPIETYRDRRNSSGNRLVISTGRSVGDLGESRGFWMRVHRRGGRLSAEALRDLNEVYLGLGRTLTNLDAVEGSSGSMVLDARGVLRAMVTATGSGPNRFSPDLTTVQSVVHIKSELDRRLGPEANQALWDCRR